MRRFLQHILLSLMLLSVYSTRVEAKTFAAGLKKYEMGDFRGAEIAFIQALKAEKANEGKAKLYKYLGITQYMQAKSNAAATNFKKALQFNPSTTIDKNEVLDESILSFFGRIKTQNRVTAAKPAAAAGGDDVAFKSKFGKATKTTYLRINSNVRNASVMIDGILSGGIGQLMEADAGNALIELEAPGYVNKKVKTMITKNRENILTINMEKKKPKPKLAPPTAVKSPLAWFL